MSRIADVIQKSHKARAASSPGQPDAPDPQALRPMSDVDIPWQLDATAETATTPVPEAPAAPVRIEAPAPGAVAPPRIDDSLALTVDDERIGLARRLFLPPDGPSVRSVLLCGADVTRAASEIAVGIALALGRETTGSICLIDLDLEGPADPRLTMDETAGASEAILEGLAGKDCAQRLRPASSLWLMPAGPRRGELRAMLGQAQTITALRSLLASFDYVVAHAAAAGTCDDAAVLAGAFDGVVLVLDAQETTPGAARAAAAVLQDAGAQLLGTVVNKRGKRPDPGAR